MRRRAETVVRLTPKTKTGRYSGEPEIDWTQPPTETPIEDVRVAPGATDEVPQVDREAVEIAFTLYAPPGTIVDRLERVRVRGEDFDVQGEPQVWTRGVVIAVTRKEG